MPDAARHEARITETARGHRPGHSPHIARNIGLVALIRRRHNHRQLIYQRSICARLINNRVRKLHLPGIQLDAAHLLQRTHHHRSHLFVRQTLVVAGKEFILHSGPGAHRSALGGLQRTRKDILHSLAGRAAEVVFNAGAVRHHVGSLAAIRNNIVDAGGLGNMLAHQIHHIIEGLDRIQGGTAGLRSAGSVGRYPPEGELHLHVGQAGGLVDGIARVGMPVEHCVQALEYAFAHHIGLASPALFRRASEEFHRALAAGCCEPFAHCHCAGDRSGAEEIVPAGMSGSARHQHFPVWHGILAHSGDGIILRHHADNRPAVAKGSHERRGDAGNSALHRKSLTLKEVSPLLGALELLVAGLGIVEDALLQRIIEAEIGIQVFDAGGINLFRARCIEIPSGNDSGAGKDRHAKKDGKSQ